MRFQNYLIFLITMLLFSGLIADDSGLKNYKENKFEEAKVYYEQILAARKNDAAASLGLGASQYQLGDVSNAAKSFEEALKTDKSDIQDRAYYNLGNVLYNQQQIKESVAFYRKALESNPNDDDAKFNYELAKYFAQQQDEENQEEQNDQQDQQDQKDDNSNKDNNQDNDSQDTKEKEPDKQDEEKSDSSEEEKRDSPKSQQQMNAEAILDALKDEEKIHQKVKMAQQSARKFEKDW